VSLKQIEKNNKEIKQKRVEQKFKDMLNRAKFSSAVHSAENSEVEEMNLPTSTFEEQHLQRVQTPLLI
jgi:hypothetical protein